MRNRIPKTRDLPEGAFIRFIVAIPNRQIKVGDCRHVSHDTAKGLVDLDLAVHDVDMNRTYTMFGKLLADAMADTIINVRRAVGGIVDEHRTRLEFRTSMAKSFGCAPDEFTDDLSETDDEDNFLESLETK